jgi:spore germination protein
MRLSRTLFAAPVLLALAAVLVGPTAPSAAATLARIQLAPDSGPAGTTTTVSGGGFPRLTNVTLTVSGAASAVRTDKQGAFRAALAVRPDAAAGDLLVTATAAKVRATASFRVLPPVPAPAPAPAASQPPTPTLSPEPAPAPAPTSKTGPTVAAYVVPWAQSAGFATVDAQAGVLTQHSPWWYAVGADARSVVVQSSGTVEDAARSVAAQRRGVDAIPTVGNHRAGAWTDDQEAMLADPVKRAAHVQALVDLAVSKGYAGIDVDFEDTAAPLRQQQSDFAAALGRGLRAQGKKLVYTVHPKENDAGYDWQTRNGSQDYAALGAAADEVRVMAYDWHWATSPRAGAIAPLPWVDSVARYAASTMLREKVVLGVALWGYDWPIRSDGTTTGPATDRTWEQVQAILARTGAQPRWDDTAKASVVRYTEGGQLREIWYEDARSVAAKLDVVAARGLGGVFFWRLGGEDPAVWSTVAARTAQH